MGEQTASNDGTQNNSIAIKLGDRDIRGMNCIYPECKAAATGRGLCGRHYNQARKIVKDGLKTWEELEVSGKCLKIVGPPKPKRKQSAWFLDDGKGEVAAVKPRASLAEPEMEAQESPMVMEPGEEAF